MKRILIFSLAYYPHVGGAEVAIKEITDRTPDIEFHLITKRFDTHSLSTEKTGNVFVYRIGPMGRGLVSKFIFQFTAALFALKLHKKYNFGATWAMMAHSAGVPAALFKLVHPNVPYILNLQEGDPIAHIERTMLPLWPLFTYAFRKADIVQPLSAYLAKWARARHFKGPIEIIPNGVDVKRFLGDSTPHDGVVLITTSRLVEKNAVDDIIRALALLPDTMRLQVLGVGHQEPALRVLASELGVASRVEFLGHVDHKILPSYLHAADIFIRPSRSEGFGASFMEAMASGIPVIATQEGGIADFLFDSKRNPGTPSTGWAVDKNSPQQIADTVMEILSSKGTAQEVTKNARAMVLEKYDWNTVAHDMHERVFAKVLKL